MKKQLFLCALTLFCTTVLSAQTSKPNASTECKPLTIKFLGFADPEGHRVRGTDLRDMLECVHDKKINNQYKTGQAMDWVGAGLVAVGSIVIVGVSLSPKDPLTGYSEEQLRLAALGLKTMGLGVGVQLGGLLVKKSAANRYNKLVLSGMSPESIASLSATAEKAKYVGFAIGKTFYKWGMEPPKLIYMEGFRFDDNSEIANSGFYLSAFSENKISKRFRGRAEFSWVQRGFGLSLRGSNTSYKADSKTRALTNYLEAAWLAQFVANPSKPGILLSAGPGLGFLMNTKIKSRATVRNIQSGESGTSSSSTKVDMEDYSFGDRIDYGLHLGAGARWPVGDSQLCFDVRYFLGLKNINDDQDSSEKIFNRGWSIGLGYAMPF